MNEIYNSKSVEKYLKNKNNIFVKVYGTVTSTNLLALDEAKNGAPEGTLIASSSQTNGRGRLGRSFYSPDASGVYMSLVLRPDLKSVDITKITAAAAVAVCRAIESVSDKKLKIKWVNDIMLENRKVCGILVQSVYENGGFSSLVLGVGVNLLHPKNEFPDDIKDIAGCVFDSPFEDMRSVITAKIADNLFDICKTPIQNDIVAEYQDRSMLKNCKINVIQNNTQAPATVCGIDSECRLVVEYDDGTRGVLSGGEVSVRKV